MKSSNKPTRPGVRSLKLQPKYRVTRWSSSTVPELRLCGKWLAELGFAEDDRVEVHTSSKLIVIRPQQR